MSLILGVLGVVPVFADVADATCVVDDSEGLSVTWNGVPAGLELILLAETSNGRLRTVVTGNVDNVVGYGSSGSWTGTPERRAVAYSLYGDPAAGGGSIPCAPPGSTTDRDTPVEIAVHNGIGASNPGFQTGTCPSDPDGRKYGWHFILTGNSSSFVAVDVVFESAGRVTDFVSDPTPKHAYVYTAAPDVIVSASAVIDGPAGTRLVLSHVCTPAAAPAPSPTATASVEATSTVPQEPTSTATPAPTSTVTLVPTSTASPEPTSTATPVPTSTVTLVPTSTVPPEPTSTASPEPTSTTTPRATTTATPLPTSTPVPDREPDLMAKIVVDCGAGVFSASITNSGGGAGLAEFVLDGVVVGTATVSAGETLVVAQPIPVGLTNFAVVADGATLASSSVTDPCAVPAPELHVATALDCSADTIPVSVENRGTAVGTASVSVNGAVVRLDVAPGATETVHVDRPRDTTEADIVVTSGEVVLLRQLLDTSCTVAGPDLRASVVVACKTGTQPESAIAEVTVVNDGELAGTAGITAAGVTQNVVVAAGDAQIRTYDVAGTGPVSVTVVHNQSVLAAFATTDLCDTPEPEFHAEATLKCEIDKVEVLVDNSGTGDGVAYVEINGLTAVLDVPAASSAWHEAPVLVGDSNRVVVHDGNVNLLDITFEDSCTAAEADLGAAISVDCAASAATVTLINTGDVAGTAAISLDTVEIAAILVGPGETITHVVDFDPVAGHTVLVTAAAGSVELMTAAIDPCSTPESDISAVSLLDCDAGSVTVTVANNGDAPGTAVIALDGTQETVVVAPGQVVVRSATVAAGDTSTVQVTVDGIAILDEVTSDTCTIPEAAIVASTVLDCGNREIVVRLENGGTVAGEAAVVINGVSQTVAVPAESSLTVPGAITAAGDYLVDVSVDGMSILTEQATGACAVPQGSVIATIDLSCTHAEARVAISNGLAGEVVVTLTVNGTDESVSIPAGQVVERAVRLAEDEAYDISVGAEDGVLLVTSSGTFDCENADVKAKTKLQDPKDPAGLTRLPRTGAASSAVLATAGVALVLTGAVAMKASSVRRERLAEVT